MKNKQAFTLIELLVVVLIIGILAAVALPQYQKAVEKAKAAQALTMLKSVYQAAKSYVLANGAWPASFDELALEVPWNTTHQFYKGQREIGNSDWAVSLFVSSYTGVTAQGVIVARVSGPYAGAGFIMYHTPINKFSSDEVVCVEVHNTNNYIHPFAKSRGDYCKKIFKGQFVDTGHWEDYFKIF